MKNTKEKRGCFLCEELKKNDDPKNYILHRGKHSFVIMNLYPYNNGHLLIVPNSHVPEVDKLPVDELADLMRLTQASVDILRKEMHPEGFNIGINIGKAAGAGLPEHLHIQIVPRWTGDTSCLTVFDETRVMPESLDGTYARLRPYFEKLKETGDRRTSKTRSQESEFRSQKEGIQSQGIGKETRNRSLKSEVGRKKNKS